MRHKPWIPAAMALALSLGLSACGNGDDEPVMEDTTVEEDLGAPPAEDNGEETLMPDTGRDANDDAAAPDAPADETNGEAVAPDEPGGIEQEPAATDEDTLGSDDELFDAETLDEQDTKGTLGDDP